MNHYESSLSKGEQHQQPRPWTLYAQPLSWCFEGKSALSKKFVTDKDLGITAGTLS